MKNGISLLHQPQIFFTHQRKRIHVINCQPLTLTPEIIRPSRWCGHCQWRIAGIFKYAVRLFRGGSHRLILNFGLCRSLRFMQPFFSFVAATAHIVRFIFYQWVWITGKPPLKAQATWWSPLSSCRKVKLQMVQRSISSDSKSNRAGFRRNPARIASWIWLRHQRAHLPAKAGG